MEQIQREMAEAKERRENGDDDEPSGEINNEDDPYSANAQAEFEWGDNDDDEDEDE